MKQKNSPKPKKKISLMFDDYPIIGIYSFVTDGRKSRPKIENRRAF